ncbi:hypothetical protein GDO81_000838 [Engystomops pustulosus]|uniref:Maturase K n=1 Tax=Engystomops pustulosus TaxID=76066 RepID=A0AAV7D7N4_ENGPU|nr:hypothetical protein GDO81_000838 [Engystomops pustulosus]
MASDSSRRLLLSIIRFLRLLLFMDHPCILRNHIGDPIHYGISYAKLIINEFISRFLIPTIQKQCYITIYNLSYSPVDYRRPIN